MKFYFKDAAVVETTQVKRQLLTLRLLTYFTRFNMNRKFASRSLLAALPLVGAMAAPMANSAEVTVTVTNLTQGIHFTPLMIAAHDGENHIFEVGTAATTALAEMAEGGSLGSLEAALSGINADMSKNPAGGLLAPGAQTTTTLNTADGNDYLSLVAMLLPTNDGFVGLDSWKIKGPGTYTINLSGYDAGTEANDELLVPGAGGALGTAGIPAAPGGDAGTGGTGVTTTQTNNLVHIHPGVLGDTDATGGTSDLDSRVHRWLNPVARITITVK